MRINRERFLALAAAIASGCNSQQQPTVPPVQVPVATTPIPAPTPPATAIPEPVPDEPPPTPTAKKPNPYDGTPLTAQTCDAALNKVGTPPKCKIAAPGPTCESIEDTKKECPTMNSLLKPRVAEAAIECLNKRSKTDEICEFNVSSICAYEALGSACLDPAAKTACNAVVSKCGAPKGNYNKMTRGTCEAAVSGIADAKRKKFISCISEFCRFETCLTYL